MGRYDKRLVLQVFHNSITGFRVCSVLRIMETKTTTSIGDMLYPLSRVGVGWGWGCWRTHVSQTCTRYLFPNSSLPTGDSALVHSYLVMLQTLSTVHSVFFFFLETIVFKQTRQGHDHCQSYYNQTWRLFRVCGGARGFNSESAVSAHELRE